VVAAYSVYWRQELWQCAATVGCPLTVLFGGPHSSQPSFRRATVQPRDLLYPIGVRGGVLHVFGRMRVEEIVAVGGRDQQPRLEQFLADYGEWRFLASTCTTEAVISCEGTGIYLDRPVPGEILKRLTYHPRRGPRPVKHVSEDGHLLHVLSVQGIYRLAESSAADLEAVLTGPLGNLITRPQPAKNQHQLASTDTLF
jgi:hypothetical protein